MKYKDAVDTQFRYSKSLKEVSIKISHKEVFVVSLDSVETMFLGFQKAMKKLVEQLKWGNKYAPSDPNKSAYGFAKIKRNMSDEAAAKFAHSVRNYAILGLDALSAVYKDMATGKMKGQLLLNEKVENMGRRKWEKIGEQFQLTPQDARELAVAAEKVDTAQAAELAVDLVDEIPETITNTIMVKQRAQTPAQLVAQTRQMHMN